MFITLNYSLENLSESEIENDMKTFANIARSEYNDEFKVMQRFANPLIRRNVFVTLFEQRDADALQTIIAYEIGVADMDFAIIVDPDMSVFITDSTDISSDVTPFSQLVKDALQGKTISSTETVILKNPGKEHSDTVLVQVYLTPIQINERTAGVFITGRILNNMNRIPDDINNRFVDTTTTVYQGNNCIDTSSKYENEAFIGTVLPLDIMKGLSPGETFTGEIQCFSTLHVFGAVSLTSYSQEVVGVLLVSIPKAHYNTVIENLNQKISIIVFIFIVSAIIFIIVNVKEITAPINKLEKAVRSVADEEGYEKIEILSNDEIGELAGSFNKMVDSLIERDNTIMKNTEEITQSNIELLEYSVRLQDQTAQLEAHQEEMIAYADILKLLNSTLDLNTITSEGLMRLMNYTNSPVGAIYLYDPDNQTLIPKITQGAQKIVEQQLFTLGEGIPGLTAVNKKMTIIRDLPEDTIYAMEAGVCETPPQTVVSTPMIFNDLLLGVVVTCHLDEVRVSTQLFIQRIVDQLAVSVNNANYFIQTQEMAAMLKNQRDELEIQSNELKAASKTKSEFLANMSHELRTPLNSIIGFSEVLHDQTFGPANEKQLKYFNNILTSGKHLLGLINDILDLSKVEADKVELIFEEFDILTPIIEVKTLVASIASKKNIMINVSITPEITTINADIGKFKQILFNLLSNAIKFSPDKSAITLDVRRIEDMVRISVVDKGIGISEQDQEKLFKSFVQIDSSISRQYEGTGLGLALVKRFVELHGGKVWVESKPGTGSTFTFTIPVNKKEYIV